MPILTAINLYPIKSCGRVPVTSGVVEARGLQGDRRYMLVDGNGRFVTQRAHPAMAFIQVTRCGDRLRVEAPDRAPLTLPATLQSGEERRVKIWRGTSQAFVAEPAVNEWFSAIMGFHCELVYMGEQHHRSLRAGRGRAGDEVSFADGAPLLLISEASLTELNRRLDEPVEMNRFRPNLVTSADEPFAEDSWTSIRIGLAELEVAWACTRCVLTTIDPKTGVKDPGGEPLTTLKRFRRGPEGVRFGQNLVPRRLGTVRVGDSVELL